MNTKTLYMLCFTFFLHGYKQPYIPLFGAAKLGSKKHVHQLLACDGVNPNQIDAFGNTPLHYAVYIDSKEVTNELLKFNANTNIQNKKGKTPLHIAVQHGNAYIARCLMTYGANPNCADSNGDTPLHSATKDNNRLQSYRVICDLLSFGADPSLKNKANNTPLMLAQTLCTNNCNVNRSYKQQKNAQRILAILTQNNQPSTQYSTLDRQYKRMAKSTHVDKMQHLLKCPAINVNQQFGKLKRTALMYAARNNRTKMVSYLIHEIKVDKMLKDAHGKTAYDYAKKHGNQEMLRLLKV